MDLIYFWINSFQDYTNEITKDKENPEYNFTFVPEALPRIDSKKIEESKKRANVVEILA